MKVIKTYSLIFMFTRIVDFHIWLHNMGIYEIVNSLSNIIKLIKVIKNFNREIWPTKYLKKF